MSLSLGIDIGTVSVKAAVFGEPEDRPLLQQLADAAGYSLHPASRSLLLSPYRRSLGDPVPIAKAFLVVVRDVVPDLPPDRILLTGSGARLLQAHEPIQRVNDFKALAAAVAFLHPDVVTVFEMGGESSRFLRLAVDAATEQPAIFDYETNGDCAAGTGAFMDQQAHRLRYRVEEVGDIALTAPSAARVAGRCSVFAKSDTIHAQQKGATPPQILRDLCDAVARNFKGSISKGKPVVPPVAFVGGKARNAGIAQSLRELYTLADDQFLVPAAGPWYGAIGAALLCARGAPRRAGCVPLAIDSAALSPVGDNGSHGATARPLSLENVLLLRDRVRPPQLPAPGASEEAYVGIDVGSVSTNLVVLDAEGAVLHEIYVRTDGRPIEVVREGLRAIERALGNRIRVCGAGTTGSGRELIGELVGADTITDEITAHTAGATHVARTLLGESVDTIFEIGGQDAKFIALEDGVVVDFAMNEACAAGTGSFLEEQAERLGVLSIKDEFSRLAFRSRSPVHLGERCTVFMEQDVNAWQQRGAAREDLVAGLAYSVALNYLHRVVRGRRIGRAIYFQGGTAYNDAVAAAFAGILGARIIVPPHNGVIGAIGVGLLAQEKARGTGRPTTFRGFDLEAIRYSLRGFVCRACSNLCDMQEFTVEGVRTYWGDKCSDKFRRRAQTERAPLIPDLMALRRERLLDGYGGSAGSGPCVGIPRAMFFHNRFPFWRAFLEALDCRVVLSNETDRKIVQDAVDLTVAEPCYPIRVAHGHVKDLVDKGADWILLPNVMNAEPTPDATESQMCPWAQTLPYVVRAVPRLAEIRERILAPTVHLRLGEEHVGRDLVPLGRTLGARRAHALRAVAAGFAAQRRFQAALEQIGGQALATLEAGAQSGIILVGRPYNIHDRAVNLDVPGKLRGYYGINVIPLDCLPLDGVDIRDVNDNMYWHSGRRILAAAFRSAGIAASVLPSPDNRTLELGVRYLTGDECLPAKITLGDYLKVTEAPGFNPARTAFMMPTTEGPCRFGQYSPSIRKALRDIGFAEVAILSPTSGDGYDGMGAAAPGLKRVAWRATVASDILRKLLLKTRPYERTRGDADRAYKTSLGELCAALETPDNSPRAHLARLAAALTRIRDRFRSVPAGYERGRLLIGIQGEIFCRMEEFSNDQLIRRLEACGAEAWLSDISEWIWYCNVDRDEALRHAGGRFSLASLGAKLRDRIQHADEVALRAPFSEDFRGYEDPEDIREVLRPGRPYLPLSGAEGEMVLSEGKVDYFFRRGVDGVIDISPFSCMNGIASEALYPRQSAEHAGLPIRNFYFDGASRDLTVDLEMFLELTRSYQRTKSHPRRYPPWFR